MQFSTSLLLSTTALLSTAAAADGIFAITGNGVVSTPITVTLQVQNGLVGEPPKCSGSVNVAALPASGTIPCNQGYSLNWTWPAINQAIAATYSTPSSPPFTYNVPNLGCDGKTPQTCQFGFTNIFPGKAKRSFKA